jgi:hypothetical protein
VFDKAGTFDYYCSFHEFMTGRVVVRANSAALPGARSRS